MRKTLTVVGSMLVLALFLLLPCAFADSVSLSVASPATVTLGSTFVVDVNVSNVTDLYDFQLDLNFDPSVLSATGITEGAFLPTGGSTFFIPGTIDNTGGTIAFNGDSLLSAVSGVSGSGTLMQFDFTALALGTSPLTIGNEILQDSTGNILSDTPTAGSVTVAPVPEPATLLLLATGLCALLAIGLWRH